MKERKIPMRRCVGCMESKDKRELIRIAIYEGKATVDESGRAKGRGIYLCRNNPSCVDAAIKRRAFERALQRQVTDEEKATLLEALSQAAKEAEQK